MKTLSGLASLIQERAHLPDCGWIYIDKGFDTESRADILKGQYYIAENDDDEMHLEEKNSTFLEAPMFNAIVENTLSHNTSAGTNEFIEAILYYLENDDFQD